MRSVTVKKLCNITQTKYSILKKLFQITYYVRGHVNAVKIYFKYCPNISVIYNTFKRYRANHQVHQAILQFPTDVMPFHKICRNSLNSTIIVWQLIMQISATKPRQNKNKSKRFLLLLFAKCSLNHLQYKMCFL